MFGIGRDERDLNFIIAQHSADPAAGFAVGKDIRRGRQINQMNAAFHAQVPVMRMAVETRLDLLARANDFEQCLAVPQPADFAEQAGIVMEQEDRRFVRMFIQRVRQPIQLFMTESARRQFRSFERIQHEPVGAWRLV